jgi:hypothetical protein
MNRRKPAYAALVVIGLALIPLAITGNPAFWGVSVVFFVLGAAGLAREKKAARKDKDDQGAT